MALRIPRGFDVNRPPYAEICEGERPNVQSVPLEAWTGLPPVRIDEQHHDPIVIDAGTLVGIATGTSQTNGEGKLFPAVWVTGNADSTAVTLNHVSDGATWGLSTSTSQTIDVGNIKPLGVVYQPIYSFNLQAKFTNYKRNDNVGVLTDYVISIPCITTAEHAIRAGDVVCVANNHLQIGTFATLATRVANEGGRFKRLAAITSATEYSSLSATDNLPDEYIVGRCLKSFVFGTGAATTKLQGDTTFSIATAGTTEFRGLGRVQTVPGLALSGSGTGGVPGHMLGGVSDGSSNYRALTILIRM